jgi:hypothetical protein
MAIALRGSATSATSISASSVSINYPTGHVSGDVLVMMVSHIYSGGLGITTPTGWTLLTSQTVGFILQKTFWRVDDGTLGSSLTVNVNLSGGTNVIMYAFSGASTSAPASAQYAGNATTSATATFNALGTWASNNGWDLCFATFYQGGSAVTAGEVSGYTSGPTPNVSTWGRSHANDLTQTGVTTIGSKTATWSASRDNATAHIFIGEPVTAVTTFQTAIIL